jgi:hypothetical protein
MPTTRFRLLTAFAALATAATLAFAGPDDDKKPTTTTTTKASTTTTKATTTTTKVSTTTTTEEPTTSTTEMSTTTTTEQSTTTTETTAPSTTVVSTSSTVPTTTTTLPGGEQCGNCADDDGDGLTDFEDPDCCEIPTTLTVRQGLLRSNNNGPTSRFALRGCIEIEDRSKVDPLNQDVYVQIRDTQTNELFCSLVPAAKFMRLHKSAVAFWDRSGKVTSARGIEDLAVLNRKSCLGFYTLGRNLQLASEQGVRYKITSAFKYPEDKGATVCATTRDALVTGKPIHFGRRH